MSSGAALETDFGNTAGRVAPRSGPSPQEFAVLRHILVFFASPFGIGYVSKERFFSKDVLAVGAAVCGSRCKTHWVVKKVLPIHLIDC